jgi:hypothetical protein
MIAQLYTEIPLVGLDGSNPLAFLAALGVVHALSAAAAANAESRLRWTAYGFVPTVCVAGSPDRAAVLDTICGTLRRWGEASPEGVAGFADVIGIEPSIFDGHVRKSVSALTGDGDHDAARQRLRFAAAYGSGSVSDGKSGKVIPTALSFANGQSNKKLLKDFRTLAGRLTADRLSAALLAPWAYDDVGQPTLRWDPLDLRTYAHMATDPGATDTRSVMAANALAFAGLGLLPSVPAARGLRTAGVSRRDGVTRFAWPLWDAALMVDAITSLLCQDWADPAERRARGIVAAFASRRTVENKGVYFSPAVAI